MGGPRTLRGNRKPRANVARGLPLGIPAGRSFLFRLRLDFFALFPHGLQDRGLLLKLGGLFAGQRLDTFQTVSRPDGVVRELPLPCAHAGSPAKAAAFQLGPGVRVRLSIKEHLQVVVLPVHFHTAPVKLPAGKTPAAPVWKAVRYG